jgi:hypothetical protein
MISKLVSINENCYAMTFEGDYIGRYYSVQLVFVVFAFFHFKSIRSLFNTKFSQLPTYS